MSTSSKRSWTAEEKLAILQEARIPGNSVSDVCRRKQVAPAQFYLWEKQARQGALQALKPGQRGRKPQSVEARMELELQRLRTVVAELVMENLEFKRGRSG